MLHGYLFFTLQHPAVLSLNQIRDSHASDNKFLARTNLLLSEVGEEEESSKTSLL